MPTGVRALWYSYLIDGGATEREDTKTPAQVTVWLLMVGFGEVWASDDDFAFLDEPTDDVKTKDADVEMKQSGLDLNGDHVCSVWVGQ